MPCACNLAHSHSIDFMNDCTSRMVVVIRVCDKCGLYITTSDSHMVSLCKQLTTILLSLRSSPCQIIQFHLQENKFLSSYKPAN